MAINEVSGPINKRLNIIYFRLIRFLKIMPRIKSSAVSSDRGILIGEYVDKF